MSGILRFLAVHIHYIIPLYLTIGVLGVILLRFIGVRLLEGRPLSESSTLTFRKPYTYLAALVFPLALALLPLGLLLLIPLAIGLLHAFCYRPLSTA